MRVAPLVWRDGDRDELAAFVRSKTVRAGVARRGRMMLLAADGESNTQIAHTVGVSRPTVTLWRRRYEQAGIVGLVDEHRSGRPRSVGHAKVVAATLAPPPKKYGVTHWSSRLLGNHLGIDNTTVAAAWREYGVKPWRSATFKFSTAPELVAKVTDVVGLYLAPPENAIVLCVDEKSQIQALDQTAPMRIGLVWFGSRNAPTTTFGTARRRCSQLSISLPARSPDCVGHGIVIKSSSPFFGISTGDIRSGICIW